MKRTLKTLLLFLSNARHDIAYHLFDFRHAWFDAQFEVLLEETFATAHREEWSFIEEGDDV